VRKGVCRTRKFYARGIKLYPPDEIYRQTAFIAYYFNWGRQEVLNLPHSERLRFCGEISRINKERNGGSSNNIFEV
jgi:hypothetical protein